MAYDKLFLLERDAFVVFCVQQHYSSQFELFLCVRETLVVLCVQQHYS